MGLTKKLTHSPIIFLRDFMNYVKHFTCGEAFHAGKVRWTDPILAGRAVYRVSQWIKVLHETVCQAGI